MNTHGMTPNPGTPGNYVIGAEVRNSPTEGGCQAEYRGREVIMAVFGLKRLHPAFCLGGSRSMALSHWSAAMLVAICLFLGVSSHGLAQCTNDLSITTRQHGHGGVA